MVLGVVHPAGEGVPRVAGHVVGQHQDDVRVRYAELTYGVVDGKGVRHVAVVEPEAGRAHLPPGASNAGGAKRPVSSSEGDERTVPHREKVSTRSHHVLHPDESDSEVLPRGVSSRISGELGWRPEDHGTSLCGENVGSACLVRVTRLAECVSGAARVRGRTNTMRYP